MSLPDRPAARKPRRLGLILPWLALVLLAGGWSAAWFKLKAEAVARMDAAVAGMRTQGYQVSWDQRTVGGFPFRLDVNLTAPRIAEPSGWALAAPVVKSEAWIYRLDQWVMVLPAGLTLTRPQGGDVLVRADALRASLGGLDQRPPRLSVEGAGLRFDPAAGGAPYFLQSAERLELHLRPGPDNQGGMLFRVDGARLRLEGLPARVAQGRPVSLMWDLALSRMSELSGANWPAAVRRWRNAGGVITVRAAEIRGGDALLAGSGGPLTVGPDGRLEGEMKAALKEAKSGTTALSGQVSLKDGRVVLGPLDVGPSPRLY
ncbi:MAG: DUF2125 domain-containing protein [Caulobacter sp.]|nr:DUF2125 domain-containing protein [Caulobacter sp.]